MAEDTWQLSLDPNDEKSWRKGGGAQGRGVIVDTSYELWGFPPKEGKQRIVQVYANITIAFQNMDRLWSIHQMAGWPPGDKDPKTGLAPSVDGKEPAGGNWDRIIAIREGREALPDIHPFKGPLVVRRGNAQFVEEEQFWQNLKSLSDASIANLGAGAYSLHVQSPGGPRVAPGNFGLDISWMIGLDCDFLPQDSTRPIRKSKAKASVLAEAAEPEDKRGPVQVLCAVGLYGKKTPEEVEALKQEYAAREAANASVAPGSITPAANPSGQPASSTSALAAAKAGGGKKKMDLPAELVKEFEDALVEALSRDSCSFEIDLEGQRVKLDHTGLRDSLMQPIVNQLKGVDKKTKFAYWIQHELPAVASERWEYDASTNLISLKG